MLVQVVEDHLSLSVPPQLNDHAHALPVRFVPYIRYAVYLLVPGHLGDTSNQTGLVYLIGQLRDDDLIPASLELIYLGPGAHNYLTVSRGVELPHKLPVPTHQSHGFCGKIRTLNYFQQVLNISVGVVYQTGNSVTNLAQVMGRDAGSHTHRDTRGSIDEQIGETPRQYHRLLQGVVKVGGKVHRIQVDVRQHLLGDAGQPRFRVAHGRGGIVVYAAKVPLAINQGVPKGEILGHPNQSIVDRTIAVRVIFT